MHITGLPRDPITKKEIPLTNEQISFANRALTFGNKKQMIKELASAHEKEMKQREERRLKR